MHSFDWLPEFCSITNDLLLYMEVLEKICSELEAARKENDLVVKNEELRLIRGREVEGVQKIKELEQVVKSLEMQNSRLEEDIEAQSCHTE